MECYGQSCPWLWHEKAAFRCLAFDAPLQGGPKWLRRSSLLVPFYICRYCDTPLTTGGDFAISIRLTDSPERPTFVVEWVHMGVQKFDRHKFDLFII